MKKFNFILIFALICAVSLTLLANVNHASAAVQNTLYVSPTGDDSNPGTQSQPFLTLQRAQTEVRTLNTNMTGDIEVILMDGTYQLASTLTFTSEDSGTNGFNVIYKADTGSTPVISGGTPVTGWTLHDAGKNIYKAFVGTTLDTRQVYVNGLRATRAKSASNPGFTKTSTGYTAPSTGTYSTIASWGNISNIEIVSQYEWVQHRIGVASISGTNLTMKNPGFSNANSRGTLTNASWIENAYELLDAQGEWYLNRSDGYLYYIPRTGEDLSTATVIAATLEKIIQGNGTLDNPVHNIKLDGLTFSYNTWLRPNSNYGYADQQAGVVYGDDTSHYNTVVTPGGVDFTAAKNITIQNSTFTKMGSAGISFNYGSQDNTIDHNTFTDISGGGIAIGGVNPDIYHHPTDSRNIVKNNAATNNTVTKIGVEYWDGVGIFAGYTEGTVISHNSVYDVPYTGISMGWGWGQVDTLGPTIAKNNTISHNVIHDFMKTLKDGGGIYTLGQQTGSKIYNNYIYANKNIYSSIYLDNGSSGFYTTNNVISKFNSSINTWYFTNTGGSPAYTNSYQNTAKYNYFTSGMSTLETGGTNIVAGNYAVVNSAWDTTAQAIIANAGVDGGSGPAPIDEVPSFDGFENGFGNWGNVNGIPSTSTTTIHSGSNSYELNQDQDAIYQSFSTPQNKVVSMWFYDDASVTNMQVAAFVNDNVSNRAIEVVTGNSATKYSYRLDGTHYTSNVLRTTGWHKFTWDYTSGTKVDMYIDGTLIASPTGLTSFNKISIGDFWGDGLTGTAVKFDDVQIMDAFAPPASANLKLWLKADAGVTTDGSGYVSSWSDQSGNSNTASQGNATYQPTLVNNGVYGQPVIRFDGANDSIVSSGVTGNMNTFTLIFVLKPQTVTDYNQSIQASGGWGQFAFHTTSTGQLYAGTSTSSRITPADGPGTNTMIPNNWYKFAYVFNNGSAKLFKNGVQLASKTVTNPASWTGFQLGKNNDGTINGDIAEVLIYNSALSDSDRQSIESYLQSKYGF